MGCGSSRVLGERYKLSSRESHLVVSHQGVYWNGALHWFVQDESLKLRSVIMSFDLSEERFHWEPPVPEVDADIVLQGLEIHGTSLFIYNYDVDPRIEAWITVEHRRGGLWTKLFTVNCIPAFINWDKPLSNL
ncbi:hypothetical protein NL676_021379 [Syzygium grande]|nr:hypothetical protein NL676_021379 [Syzygium grande]